MRLSFHIILSIISISLVATQELPQCAITCVLVQQKISTCPSTDFACQCASKPFQNGVVTCLSSNCTNHDFLTSARTLASECQFPIQDRSNIILWIFYSAVVLSTTLVLLRLVSNRILRKVFYAEDWLIVGAQIIAFASVGFVLQMVANGFGKHSYQLTDEETVAILENLYFAENAYPLVLALSKLSILACYLRIFEHNPGFRRRVFYTMGFIVLSILTLGALLIFQCHPISFAWDKDIVGGTCLNINAIGYSNAAMSIVQDFIVILLPIPVVVRLTMERRKKIIVGLMFAFGGFGCVVSILRLQSLLVFGTNVDPSFDYVTVIVWTAVELSVAIACSCLPALRNGYVHFRTWKSQSHQRTRKSSTPRSRYTVDLTHPRSESGSQLSFIELDETMEKSGKWEVETLKSLEKTEIGAKGRIEPVKKGGTFPRMGQPWF